jgi:hypothetical protein
MARRVVSQEEFTLPNGTQESAVVSVEAALYGQILATDWTSSTAATWEGSVDGTNFYPIGGSATTIVNNEWVDIPAVVLKHKFVKLVIGVNATSLENLTLCLKG